MKYFIIAMGILLITYLVGINYMMRYHPNYFNGIPQEYIDRYCEQKPLDKKFKNLDNFCK